MTVQSIVGGMKICITGASKGLGEALCRVAVASGHTVFGIARSEERLRGLEQELGPGRFLWSKADVADAASVREWSTVMEQRGFSPDVVILNASVQRDDLKESGYDHREGQQVLDVNLSGTLRVVEALLPAMLRRRKGTFVAIASTAMLRPSVRSAAYSASKAGIAIAMRSLNLAYGHRGVGFKTVCLGPIATEMWEGKRGMLVPSPEKAARAILTFSESRRAITYFPFISTTLLRLSLWVPDAVFSVVSAKIMK